MVCIYRLYIISIHTHFTYGTFYFKDQQQAQPQYDTSYGNQENVAPMATEPAPMPNATYRPSNLSYSPTNPYPKVPPIAISEEELERQIGKLELSPLYPQMRIEEKIRVICSLSAEICINLLFHF